MVTVQTTGHSLLCDRVSRTCLTRTRRKSMESKLQPLTYRQRKFVDALPLTSPQFNRTQEAIQAGYGRAGAAVEAVRLLRKRNVAAEIEAMKTATSRRHQITKDRLIREVAREAFLDPGAYFDSHGNP